MPRKIIVNPIEDDLDTKQTCNSKLRFPEKLMMILQDSGNESAIRWNHDGTSFSVRDRAHLCSKVLPRYFRCENDIQYHSFARKLRRWNFRRTSSGLDTRIYSHPMFLRSKPYLCSQIDSKDMKKKTRTQHRSSTTTKSMRNSADSIMSSMVDRVGLNALHATLANGLDSMEYRNSMVNGTGSASIINRLRQDASILYNYKGFNRPHRNPTEILLAQAMPNLTTSVVDQAVITMNECDAMNSLARLSSYTRSFIPMRGINVAGSTNS